MAAHASAGPRAPGSFHPSMPSAGHRWAAKLLGASMWFFIMYRARKDGGHLLGAHPWDHGHGHGHDSEHH